MFRIIPALLVASLTAVSVADVTVIEGFENSGDPGNWGPSATANHTLNATVTDSIPVYVATDVTEGVQAGKFTATWATSGTAATENVYDSAGPLTYWAVRYNINAPTSLNNNAIPTADGILEADVKNNSTYPVQVALVVDSSASSQLERGPLVEVAAGASITYTWNFATTPPVGFDTGDNAFSGTSQRVKSLLVYSAVQPTATALDVTVDNIRSSNSPDLTAPAAPRLQSVLQGAAAGEVIVRWAASPDADVASYKVYVSNDSQFGTPIANRLAFPSTPVATLGAAQLTATITGQPAGQNIYVAVTAVDNAAAANESDLSQAFGVNLEADGSAPLDRIVMDQDRYAAGSAQFETAGYFHAVVYTAQTLDSLNRTFDTVSDEAIASSIATLAASPDGIVIWSNLQDGEGAPGEALSAGALTAISNFITADGNLVVSGSGVAESLAASGGSAQLSAVLRATAVQPSIGVSAVVPVGTLAEASPISTGQNPTINTVAYATTANDGIRPTAGSGVAAEYVGVPPATAVAGVAADEALVFLGFAFESAGEASGPAGSAAVRQSLMSEMIEYLTGETAAQDWQLFD